MSVCVVDADRNRSATAYFVLLPTMPQARSVEFTVELSSMLRQIGTMHTALLVKVDRRQQQFAQDASQLLDGFGSM